MKKDFQKAQFSYSLMLSIYFQGWAMIAELMRFTIYWKNMEIKNLELNVSLKDLKYV